MSLAEGEDVWFKKEKEKEAKTVFNEISECLFRNKKGNKILTALEMTRQERLQYACECLIHNITCLQIAEE